MTPEQIQHAKALLGNADNTVSSIARLLGVSRATIYKYVPELRSPAVPGGTARLELPAAAAEGSAGTADRSLPMPKPPRAAACPTCGHRPANKHELQLHREGLETVWLLPDPTGPAAAVIERWHCERCQPHQARIIMCDLCGSTVMLGNALAEGHAVPDAAALWLAVMSREVVRRVGGESV
ncbi:helix-turn-helix domain-containing protein [Kribbella sp.]|uniref:helix-turn-helix domain-containing protein n=1 Tax=Kribbella sp. TaxID=1871183 RepID=UPI002D62B497|nr:helix-turn-helix domain-containing protein [Kribbella sp.]HZX08855.1 helix-turn-helix domain-containing protein [Kribbella sp.]